MEDGYQLNEQKYRDPLSRAVLYGFTGKVTKAVGLNFEAVLPGAAVGSICRLDTSPNAEPALAEVIGFRGNNVVLMPLEEAHGINSQSRVKLISKQATVRVSTELLGRVLDGAGRPMDGKPLLSEGVEMPLYSRPLNPLDREPIRESLDLGVRALNGMIPCGSGQRMGIMAGPGVGK
ncbi:MAG: flagellum-specific ATP synthase FliI, partial [Candidatus Omnitrophica bacterium]|nr:flagellum-specific ATP synthase FliI [Candidatus Omnitrophota bacterium]